jgi:predicted phosphatase
VKQENKNQIKMNTLGNYDEELFILLNIEPAPLSKVMLSRILYKYIKTSGYKIVDGDVSYLNNEQSFFTPLTGIADSKIYLWKNGACCWWEFVSQVYKKWKL